MARFHPARIGIADFCVHRRPWLWQSQIALGASTWYAIPDSGHSHLTLPGYWNAFVSIPIFQFVLLRWYLRLFIWSRFLWQVSRLNLNLIPTHPDRAGGLGFLGRSSYAFAPILFAQGATLPGMIANRVLYAGESLMSFKMEAVGLIAIFMLAILGPLTVFTPKLARAQREGLADYGLLASRYIEDFEQKWVKGRALPSDELLGTDDIQSLPDLGNSYAVIGEMRAVPFGVRDMMRLAAVTAAPLVPLADYFFARGAANAIDQDNILRMFFPFGLQHEQANHTALKSLFNPARRRLLLEQAESNRIQQRWGCSPSIGDIPFRTIGLCHPLTQA